MNSDNFKCPYCGSLHELTDNIIDRINNNKSMMARISCYCGKWFYVTANYRSQIVSITVEERIKKPIIKTE